MMQPYLNPNYFSNYPSQMPVYPNSQYQMQRSIPQLAGRCVNDFNEITANDVPMDGNSAVFVKNDMSEVQIRAWNANGQIVTTSYKPILDAQIPKANNPTVDTEKLKIDLSDEVTTLFNDRFDKLEKLLKPQRPKKEVESE